MEAERRRLKQIDAETERESESETAKREEWREAEEPEELTETSLLEEVKREVQNDVVLPFLLFVEKGYQPVYQTKAGKPFARNEEGRRDNGKKRQMQ